MKIFIQIAIGLAGYLVWAAMAYADPTQRADFLHFNIGMAVGTIGLVLRDMQPPPAPGQAAPPVPTTVTSEP